MIKSLRFFTKVVLRICVLLFISHSCLAQTFSTTFTNPTDMGKSDGRIALHGFLQNTAYSVTYRRNDTVQAAVPITSDMNGFVVLIGLPGAVYTDFSVMNAVANTTQNIATTITLIPGAIATQATKFFAAVYGNFTGIQDDDPSSFWQVYARLSQPLNKYDGIPIAATGCQRFIFLRNFFTQLTYGNMDNFKTYAVDTAGSHYTNRLDLLSHAYFNGNVSLNLLTYIMPKKWDKHTGDIAHVYLDVFSSLLVSNVIDTLKKNDPATLKTYNVKSGMFGFNVKAAFVSTQWNIEASLKAFKIIPYSSVINANLNPQTSDIEGASLPQNAKKDFVRDGNRAYAQLEVLVQYNTGDVPDNSGGKEAANTSNSNAFIRFASTTNFAGIRTKNYPNNYWQIQLGYALDITKLLHGQAAPAAATP